MKIKILFIASSLRGGGAERVFINIMNSLSPDKYDIKLILTSHEKIPEELLQSKILIKNYNKKHAKSAFLQLYHEIKSNKPDYLFTTHFPVAYMLSIFKFLFKRKFKVIVRIAVPPSEYPRNGLKTNILHIIAIILYRYVDIIVTQSEYMKNDVIKSYSLKPGKVIVIRNIIDHEYLQRKGSEFYPTEMNSRNYNVISAGALYSIKGFDLLIKSIALLQNKNPNIRLFILGDERYETGYKAYLKKLIKELELTQIVFLLGHKENPYPYYKNADLFVLSSRKEGFPNVVLEALYYGTPVVATNCVDFSGVITESANGYIVQKESHITIAEGINNAILNLNKSNAFTIQNFNYENLFV